MKSTLYIIGNGFDLYHGIPSEYEHFRNYLKEKSSNVYNHAEQYIFCYDGKLWANFEESFAMLDVDTLVDEASQFLVGYGAEEWSDAYHHDYQYEIEQVVDSLSKELLTHFSNWIRQLPIPSPTDFSGRLLPLDLSAQFLSFNYTPTLAKLYGVPDGQIKYIHGNGSNTTDELLIGHDWEPEDTQEQEPDPDSIDTRVEQGQSIINNYFEGTFKKTEQIIANNRDFFDSLKSIKNIVILGHSMSGVDMPYFGEIIKSVDISKVNWKIGYYQNQKNISQQVDKLYLPKSLVKYFKTKDIEELDG